MSTKLTQRQVEICQIFNSKFPVLSKGSDGDRRILTEMIVKQIAFEFGITWGLKSRSVNDSISKDTIAHNTPSGIEVWDWQNGTTRDVQVTPGQSPNEILTTGAVFIPVTPENVLNTQPGDGNGSGSDGDDGGDSDSDDKDDDFKALIKDALIEVINDPEVKVKLQALLDELAKKIKWPTYTGSIFGLNVTFTPKIDNK